uniref:Uncharacterized protein n=1 Tax=Moniliophthora roreri TaxID=221103 RepID=A0A0W0FBL5_MONRR
MEEYIRNPLDDSWETVGSDDEAYQYWQKYWNKEAELGPLSREDFLEYIPEDVFDDQALQLKRFPTLFKSIEEAITREEYEKLEEKIHHCDNGTSWHRENILWTLRPLSPMCATETHTILG